MENKKTTANVITKIKNNNKITKPIKNYKKNCESIIEIFLNMKKLKKETMLTLEIKIYQLKIEKEKNIYEKLLL